MRNIDLITAEQAKRPTGWGRRRLGLSGFLILVILILLALVVVLPLLLPWFFVFKTRLEFARYPWALPKQIMWTNFKEAWTAVKIDQGFINTVQVSGGDAHCRLQRWQVNLRATATDGQRLCLHHPDRVFRAVDVLIPLHKLNGQLGLLDTLPRVFLLLRHSASRSGRSYTGRFRGLPSELAEAAD